MEGSSMNHDVYSFGVISSSTLYLLKDEFPARSGYAEFVKRYRNVGGEAANTSLVLARLGFQVKLDGNWINPDEDARFLRDVFGENGVDITRVTFRSCQGPKEMLVVDATSRTIFGTYAQMHEEKSWNVPEKADIQNARVICLDPFFGAASLQAANYAIELNRPMVTVDCRYDDPLLEASSVAIIAEEFMKEQYPEDPVSEVTRAYRERAGGTVIFTFGHREVIYAARGEDFQTFTPYSVSTVDTTGAGDSFRAGIICGLLKAWPTRKTIRFASALAALVCQSFPGVLNSPAFDDVISFTETHESGGQ
jgi:sugar/nucleoside kinase (ribokinase family)